MPRQRRVHLICNAHLDPVWLWERDEGIAAVLSTFRCAADFCEEFDGFVFNHNEALLYSWIEEFEPPLFERIRRLAAAGKWHIMGGWYLQPDCNMLSGESFVRQILAGRRYFAQKFGARPTVAINFDPFGHDRGLVQLLARAGYEAYIVCRPLEKDLDIGGVDCRWIGYDGSSVVVHRSIEWYNSPLGKARDKIEKTLASRSDDPLLILWGVGDHGGGASRQDIRAIAELQRSITAELAHSTPEAYFAELDTGALPDFSSDLRPWGVGCYTSMARVKQGHRKLENALYGTEKIVSAAGMNDLLEWPTDALEEARKALLFVQFHDILPGSAIQEVEEAALDQIGGALDRLASLRSRALFALTAGLPSAAEGEIPIVVLNPHPYSVETVVECEFQLADQNWSEDFTVVSVYTTAGAELPSQQEKERSNLNLDWRKKIVFRATLEPNGVSRFDCRLSSLSKKKSIPQLRGGDRIVIRGEDQVVEIGIRSGLVESWKTAGRELVMPGSFAIVSYRDDADPWGMTPRDYSFERGRFELCDPKSAAWYAGIAGADLEPVRVIEDGAVRTIVEAIFALGPNRLMRRYIVDKKGQGIELEDEVLWGEANRMLKLEVPTTLRAASFVGQGAFGRSSLPNDGSEAVAKQWVAATEGQDVLLAFTDSTYGCDFNTGLLRLNLLRTAAYAAHPIGDRPLLPVDRAMPRIDRGVRRYSYRFEQGNRGLLETADRRAAERAERPFAVSFFPPGNGRMALPGCTIEGTLIVSAIKRAESDDGWIIRLFNPLDRPTTAELRFPALRHGPFAVSAGPSEVRTWKLGDDGSWTETNIIEEVVQG